MKKFLSVIVIAAMAFAMIAENCDARGRSGGGFRSSSSRSSFSRSSSKPSVSKSSWGSKKSTSSSTSKRTSVASKTDKKATRTFTKNGKTLTKKQAVSDFKSKVKNDPKLRENLKKEYPTSYKTEPKTRPSHIPQSYNGHTVVYQNGGYGYMNNGSWSPLMTYMLLDTMSDAAMMNAMSRHGYAANPVMTHNPNVHYSSSGASLFWGFFSVVLLLFICGFIFMMFNNP